MYITSALYVVYFIFAPHFGHQWFHLPRGNVLPFARDSVFSYLFGWFKTPHVSPSLGRSMFLRRSRVSSVSIVSVYGLDNRAIGVRSPGGAKDFSSSLCVHTGSGAHPASCTMGNGGPFRGGKARPGRDADHSPPSSAEVKNE
jgi:hypothetical protein